MMAKIIKFTPANIEQAEGRFRRDSVTSFAIEIEEAQKTVDKFGWKIVKVPNTNFHRILDKEHFTLFTGYPIECLAYIKEHING